MKLAIDIIKSNLLPKLEKDTSFDRDKINLAFWESFATALLDFATDTTKCEYVIYSLQLNNPDRIIGKLPTIYTSYIKELAENYVLGRECEAIDYFLKSKNIVFEKEVSFLRNLENVIIDMERERIKKELPFSYDSLVDELSSSDEKPVYTIDNKPKSRVISLSWIQYAAAACVVLAVGVFFFKESPTTNSNLIQPTENNVVSVPVKEKMENIEIPSEALAEVTIANKKVTIIENGMGYASGSNKVKVIEHNQKERKLSIEKAIEKYRLMLEKEFPDNKLNNVSRAKIIQDKIDGLNKELAELRDKEQHYKFDGKTLIMYVSNSATENAIVFYEDTYYLRRESTFYKLTIAKTAQLYKREDDSKVVNMLDQIYNGY